MRKFIYYFAFAVLLMTATSCLKENFGGVRLAVKLEIVQGSGVDVDLTKVVVKLQNKTAPFVYSATPDAAGNLTFEVQPGKYDLMASAYFKSTRIAVNGSRSEFLLTGRGIVADDGSYQDAVVTIPLSVAVPNPLIIRELYYHGSSTLEGASYGKDTYIELYNNSGAGGKTVYLDSVCIAAIYPYNSTTGNNAWLGRDTIPIAQMYWMFPGDGHTYPLAPGESAVVAAKAAVDHSLRATSGLKLNKAHFGCYEESLTGHEISAGVVPMVLTMTGQGTAWALSIHSPAIVIFKPEMGVAQYRSEASKWELYEPGKTSGTKYWHIAKSWIMDGVECVDNPAGATKRLPSDVDASYVYMKSAHYSGKCVTRTLDFTEGGIDVYKDTNNSDADFIPDSTPSPRLKQ